MKRRRAIVLVTEGAPLGLLQQWCAEGRLPAFQRLAALNALRPLRSGPVPYEVPGLTSAFTGRDPADHGWFSYWTAHSYEYRPRLLQQADQRVPYVWQRPECAGLKFAVVNLFGTHPPNPIDGWLISYPMERAVRASHPKNLLFELSQKGISYAHDVSIWYAGQLRREFVSRALDADRQRGEAARELWARGPDVMVVNLTGIDRVCHFYWQELEPGSPFPIGETAIFSAFAQCDRILGQMLELLDESTSLIAFSEIGFGPLRAYCSLNQILAEAGVLRWAAGQEDKEVSWAESRAFEAVQGTHGVNVNLKGRHRDGTVNADDYESVRAEAMHILGEAVNRHTGLPLLRKVLPREEVCRGSALEAAPDILVEPFDERYQPLGDNFWAARVNRRLQSGWHRRDSYMAAAGGPFGACKVAGDLSPADVAPTLYRALGKEPPLEFSGRVVA